MCIVGDLVSEFSCATVYTVGLVSPFAIAATVGILVVLWRRVFRGRR